MTGELIILKNRHGEKQAYLKKFRNLVWHSLPPERQQSATNNQKRSNFKNSSIYGPQSFNTGSPGKASNSPKKAFGMNAYTYQKDKSPITQYQNIRNMNTVRYAPPK